MYGYILPCGLSAVGFLLDWKNYTEKFKVNALTHKELAFVIAVFPVLNIIYSFNLMLYGLQIIPFYCYCWIKFRIERRRYSNKIKRFAREAADALMSNNMEKLEIITQQLIKAHKEYYGRK